MPIKVLIVDDSIIIRKVLTRIVEKNPEMCVIGEASNGKDALDLAKALDPDVITMDVEMPKMNGLEAVWHIMNEAPCPIVMVSSLTEEGANVTFRALELGALDFIPKGKLSALPNNETFEHQLSQKIFSLAPRKGRLRLFYAKHKTAIPDFSLPTRASFDSSEKKHSASLPSFISKPAPAVSTIRFLRQVPFDAVLIGVSTGGPPVVQKLLTALPADFPVPILIAQHMPGNFTGFFAKRLNALCAINVKEAEDQEAALPGYAYICPGGLHIKLAKKGTGLIVALSAEPKNAAYKPTVNLLMESAAHTSGRRALGVMLTGMGNDGLEGTKILKAKGGTMLAQSEGSCVVYGMPRVVIEAKLADLVVDADEMAQTLITHFSSP